MATRYFADTYYLIALLSPRDSAHDAAVEFSRSFTGELITTDAVLLEVADALRSPSDRGRVAATLRRFWELPAMTVYPVDREMMRRGLELYRSRKDKDWGLTDCISFLVMGDEELTEALTADSHFTQAGFRILFPQA
jgi:uncharacterized protein